MITAIISANSMTTIKLKNAHWQFQKPRETKKETHQTPPPLAKVILAGKRQREWSWRLLRTDWRSSSSKFITGGPVLKELLLACRPVGREEEGSQSVGIRREAASERAGWGWVRAAAEHCSLQQAGTQWPHYHTGWQGLQ